MSRSAFAQLFFYVPILLTACSSSNRSPDVRDVGADAVTDIAASDVVAVCHADIDCTDHVFCDGAEQCMPGGLGADTRGCIAATAPACMSGQTCNEAMTRCETGCGAAPDADHDGHRSIACGGDDCDDTDANRFPGNTEVCAFDATTMMRVDPTHDEDCDPMTFANAASRDGDHDGDGYIDLLCANIDRNGMINRGSDCADTATVAAVPASLGTLVQPQNIHPSEPEICNGVDDNCIAGIDEGDPGGGGACSITEVCRMTVNHCLGGALACTGDFSTPGYCCADTGDCNGVTTDGCEANLQSDVHNCGACGMVCPSTSGTPSCSSGACGYSTCGAGLTRCGTSCVNEQSDVNNCGACGHACSGAFGTPVCTAGVCGYSTCSASGLTLCGAACVSEQTDPNNCGACGHACPTSSGTPSCTAAVCGYSSCGAPTVACGAACANLQTDVRNCGACGHVCPTSLGTAACNAGACGYSACSAGLTLCGTSCVNEQTDSNNCNGCGHVCSVPNATAVSCVAAVCTATACAAPYLLNCGGATGCTVNSTTDAANCGTCGHACPALSACGVAGCGFYAPPGSPAFNPTVSTTLTSGIHYYSTVTIPVGVTITVSGTGELEIIASGAVVINGTVDVSGGPGAGGPSRAGLNPGGGGGNTGQPTGTAGTGSGGAGGVTGAGGAAPGTGGSPGGMYGGGCGGPYNATTNQPYPGGGGGGPAGGGGASALCSEVGGAGGPPGSGAAADMGGSGGGAPYDGYSGSGPCGAGQVGGGGSIGVAAATDLSVSSTFYPGSGGGGSGATTGSPGYGGGGGGGAVLIASSTSLTIAGRVLANGAIGGGCGSGGVIYLAAPSTTVGSGASISAVGGHVAGPVGSPGTGGLGRIRVAVGASCTLSGTFNPPLSAGCAASPPGGTRGFTFVGPYPL